MAVYVCVHTINTERGNCHVTNFMEMETSEKEFSGSYKFMFVANFSSSLNLVLMLFGAIANEN